MTTMIKPSFHACQVAAFRSSSFFRRLDEADINMLLAFAEPIQLAAGETLLTSGARGHYFYVLQSGILRIDSGDAPIAFELSVASVGDVIGWSSLVEPYTYSADAIAMSESELLRVDARATLEYLQSEPEAGYDVMTALATHARGRIDALMASIAGLPVPYCAPNS